jgi:hypothetical protein
LPGKVRSYADRYAPRIDGHEARHRVFKRHIRREAISLLFTCHEIKAL